MSYAAYKNKMFKEVADGTGLRGVALGGWLVVERFITPSLFTITDCDLKGNFRPYGGLQSESSDEYAKFKDCKPMVPYPGDTWNLTSAFPSKDMARDYLERHWDSWVRKEDIAEIAASGLDYLRIPIGHWIMGDIREDEPWVEGEWKYFVRVAKWAREYDLKIWADLHTAPGSQNGFDNSGEFKYKSTGQGWCGSKVNVERTLDDINNITKAMVRDKIDDVVTAFETLNEPYWDCDTQVVRDFNEKALEVIRGNLGENTSIIIGDLFDSGRWKGFWTDSKKHHDTYLDSHYYHVFGDTSRNLSPRQHIAYVCQKNERDVSKCCYNNQLLRRKSHGISRVMGEFTASFDTLVEPKLEQVLHGIQDTGIAPELHRQIPYHRQEFLRRFVEAQMVTWEETEKGISSGWSFWNFKMEGGAFAEWDYLRGYREGWIPQTMRGVPSVEQYGTCDEIIFKTSDDMSILDVFPVTGSWAGDPVNDDVVLTHGESIKSNSRNFVEMTVVASLVMLAFAMGWILSVMNGRNTTYKMRKNEEVENIEFYKNSATINTATSSITSYGSLGSSLSALSTESFSPVVNGNMS